MRWWDGGAFAHGNDVAARGRVPMRLSTMAVEVVAG